MTMSFARWKYEVIAQHFETDNEISQEKADNDANFFEVRSFHAAPTYDLVDFPFLYDDLCVDCDEGMKHDAREIDCEDNEAEEAKETIRSIICREILEDVLKGVNGDLTDSHDLCMELIIDVITEVVCKKITLVANQFSIGDSKQRISLLNPRTNGLKRSKMSLGLVLVDYRKRQDVIKSLISETQVELENIKSQVLKFEETSKLKERVIKKIKREICIASRQQQNKSDQPNPVEVKPDKLEFIEYELALLRNFKSKQVQVSAQKEDTKFKLKTVKSKIAEKERLIKSNKSLIKEIKLEISIASMPKVLKLNDVLALKFKEENEDSSNCLLCLRSFLQTDFLEEVEKVDGEIIFKFHSSEDLEKLLTAKCLKTVEWSKISKVPQRAGFVPSKLYQDFGLLVYLEETSLLKKSIAQVEQELVSCQGKVEIRNFGFAARFPTLLSCLKTLVNKELNFYHRVQFMKESVQFLGTAGDVKFFNGKVCLMEKDFLRLRWKNEALSEIALRNFITGLSSFLKNATVEEVMLDWDSRVVVTFSSQEYLESLLQEHCTPMSNSVSKVSKLPINWSFNSTDSLYNVMCGQDVDVRDFFNLDTNVLLSHIPGEVSSRSRSFPLLCLTDPAVRAFYPGIELNASNFVCLSIIEK